MAKVICSSCRKQFWADFPFGMGAFAASFLDAESGDIVKSNDHKWYCQLTSAAYKRKSGSEIVVSRKVRRQASKIAIVNCLCPWWGDAVSLILRTNQLRDKELDTVVLTTSRMSWLVPEWVSEIWIVEGGNDIAGKWHTNLTEAIRPFLAQYEACYIPKIYQPAAVKGEGLSQYSSVAPFPRSEWLHRLEEKPTITFAWRSDRCWSDELPRDHFLNSPLANGPVLGGLTRLVKRKRNEGTVSDQLKRIGRLGNTLKDIIPNLDFAVIGSGTDGELPSWVKDMRTNEITAETELTWLKRSSESHLLLGVHGSHMTLLSGHAGAVIELLPASKLVNFFQDLLITCDDVRESLFCYRLLPLNTPPDFLIMSIMSLLYDYPIFNRNFNGRYYKCLDDNELQALSANDAIRRRLVDKLTAARFKFLPELW